MVAEIQSQLRSLLAEPAIENPPKRVWRDWVLLAIALTSVAIEAVIHTDLVWRPWTLAISFGIAIALMWRRTHPFITTAGALIVISATDLITILTRAGAVEPISGASILVHVYAVFRWGSGRARGVCFGLMMVTYVFGLLKNVEQLEDGIGGIIVFLFPAVIGALVRHHFAVRVQRREQVKYEQRQQLARELHDTVAHHVSAIAVQAQAGRFLAQSDQPTSLAGASNALEVIEEEASRALAEMRAMIGSLRDTDSPADMAPLKGLADLPELATAGSARYPAVQISQAGNIDDVRPTVGAAIYRMAQESITNAVRHAHNATNVRVHVVGGADAVTLTVADDGDTSSISQSPKQARGMPSGGYGLIGMQERASLLGGNMKAGPNPASQTRGWLVEATIPCQGVSS